MKKVLLVILLFIFLFFLAGRDIWDKDFAPAALTADVAQPKEPQHRDVYLYQRRRQAARRLFFSR
ncbi:hypothetical protein [Megasphaera vaginalis (ex Srinivasan et al. 2021)]|uniref:hypothetical protein n=1 Tax=Megasphaera vaginalis (ex Srinivasan et al. 2021) TaxID=1111454 RepID=UPI00056C80E7|nr:hypothetical protein [Megasphaera vaginalis (ex Srinivasan et al. 2021)]